MLLCLVAAQWGSALTSPPRCRDGAVSEQLGTLFTPKSNRNGVVEGTPGPAIPCIAPPRTSSQQGEAGRAGSWKEVGKTDLHHKPSYARAISKETSRITGPTSQTLLASQREQPTADQLFPASWVIGKREASHLLLQAAGAEPSAARAERRGLDALARQRTEATCPWGQRMDKQPRGLGSCSGLLPLPRFK